MAPFVTTCTALAGNSGLDGTLEQQATSVKTDRIVTKSIPSELASNHSASPQHHLSSLRQTKADGSPGARAQQHTSSRLVQETSDSVNNVASAQVADKITTDPQKLSASQLSQVQSNGCPDGFMQRPSTQPWLDRQQLIRPLSWPLPPAPQQCASTLHISQKLEACKSSLDRTSREKSSNSSDDPYDRGPPSLNSQRQKQTTLVQSDKHLRKNEPVCVPASSALSSDDWDQDFKDELDSRWILNLTMRFQDPDRPREKFFVLYAETPTQWHRLSVVVVDYRNAPDDSLESELSKSTSQIEKSARIYEAVRHSLPSIRFFDTVTLLTLQTGTDDDRLHIHVQEDLAEVIPFPKLQSFDYLRSLRHVPESQVELVEHLSGFVYRVRVDDEICVKKEIPGADCVDEFLYEVNALAAMTGEPHVIQLRGLVVDEARGVVTGLLVDEASGGSLLDWLCDARDDGFLIGWSQRLRWAYQMISGLAAIHDAGFVQGDFTLTNLVTDSDHSIRVIDINRRGCPMGWEPPELAQRLKADQPISMYVGIKSDIYQLGMSLWGLATMDPDPGRATKPLTLNAFDGVPRLFRLLVDLCLEADPRRRPSARSLLSLFSSEALTGAETPFVPAMLSQLHRKGQIANEFYRDDQLYDSLYPYWDAESVRGRSGLGMYPIAAQDRSSSTSNQDYQSPFVAVHPTQVEAEDLQDRKLPDLGIEPEDLAATLSDSDESSSERAARAARKDFRAAYLEQERRLAVRLGKQNETTRPIAEQMDGSRFMRTDAVQTDSPDAEQTESQHLHSQGFAPKPARAGQSDATTTAEPAAKSTIDGIAGQPTGTTDSSVEVMAAAPPQRTLTGDFDGSVLIRKVSHVDSGIADMELVEMCGPAEIKLDALSKSSAAGLVLRPDDELSSVSSAGEMDVRSIARTVDIAT